MNKLRNWKILYYLITTRRIAILDPNKNVLVHQGIAARLSHILNISVKYAKYKIRCYTKVRTLENSLLLYYYIRQVIQSICCIWHVIIYTWQVYTYCIHTLLVKIPCSKQVLALRDNGNESQNQSQLQFSWIKKIVPKWPLEKFWNPKELYLSLSA